MMSSVCPLVLVMSSWDEKLFGIFWVSFASLTNFFRFFLGYQRHAIVHRCGHSFRHRFSNFTHLALYRPYVQRDQET